MPFPVNATDAIHIYSDGERIWLQLRRDVPTLQSIGRPSFKTAFLLTPTQAIAIAGELLTASTKPPHRPPISSPAQNLSMVAGTPANHGKLWTPDEDHRLVAAFDKQTPVPQLAQAHQRGIGGIQSRLVKLGRIKGE